MRRRAVLMGLATLVGGVLADAGCARAGSSPRQGPLRRLLGGEAKEAPAGGSEDVAALQPFRHPVGYRVLGFDHAGAGGKEYRIDVAVWYPTSDPVGPYSYPLGTNRLQSELAVDGRVLDGRYPLVLFSHGATSAGTGMTFLTERLASQGFVVAAPDYPDEYAAARITHPVEQGFLEKRAEMKWALGLRDFELNTGGKRHRDAALAYRPRIANKTIELLANEDARDGSPFRGHVDTSKVGLVGHSFGAWTSMLLAGADPTYANPRVRAIVPLSGPCNANVYEPGELERIRIPAMFMYGGEEPGVGRQSDRDLLYGRVSGPRFLLEIAGAEHMTFSGGIREEYPTVTEYVTRDPRRAAIVAYTIAFLDYYIRGEADARTLLERQTPSVTSYLREWNR